MRKLAPGAQLTHAYPSSTAPRMLVRGRPSCRAARLPHRRLHRADGSPSAAATRTDHDEVHEPRVAREALRRHAAHIEPCELGGHSSPFNSTKPSGARPSATPASCTSDGSSTTTTSGCVIESWRRIGTSSTRVNARSGAPRRSGPYSGKRLDALAGAQQRRARELRRRLRALAGARVPADLCHAQPRPRTRGRRARRASPRALPRRRSRRRLSRRRRRSTSGSSLRPVIGSTTIAPCSTSSPSIHARNSARGRWPIALTTVSARRRNSEPGIPCGRLRPLSSGSPSSPDGTRRPRRDLLRRSEAARSATRGATPSSSRLDDLVRIGRHLRLACAGRGASPRRAPRRRASRATSTAVLPPPTTATDSPTSGACPVLIASMNGSDSHTPGSSSPG